MSAPSLSGAGFGGLAAAHALKGLGKDFAVLECEQEVGAGVTRRAAIGMPCTCLAGVWFPCCYFKMLIGRSQINRSQTRPSALQER